MRNEKSSQISESCKKWQERPFVPHPLLFNKHLMTIVPSFLPRRLSQFRRSGKPCWFELDCQNKVLAYSHFQKERKLAVILLHGLEGSADSTHVLGIAFKLFACGFNVLRLNMRNCGGTTAQARSLYNAGMWRDPQSVMQSLQKDEGFAEFILVGYSLGGTLVLNTAARHHDGLGYRLRAVCTVSPALDLPRSVSTIEESDNRLYEKWFLSSMKAKMLAKCRQLPDIYDAAPLEQITTIREFDDRYTAPHGGYGTADRYYDEASMHKRLNQIKVPVFMLAAQDDPFVPVDMFRQVKADAPEIELIITRQGGHGGFFQSRKESESVYDHYWAENRVVDFIRDLNRS